MKVVTYRDYEQDLNKFINKHSKKYDYKIYTNSLKNNSYHKNYCFEDGSEFIEINDMSYVEYTNVTVHGLEFEVPVKLIKHEYWSTDGSESKYWYEKR